MTYLGVIKEKDISASGSHNRHPPGLFLIFLALFGLSFVSVVMQHALPTKNASMKLRHA